MTEIDSNARGLLLHGFGAAAEQVSAVFRSALNAAAALPQAPVEIVIQGRAVALLVDGSELAGSVSDVLDKGIAVTACENSMKSADVGRESLLPGVGTVPAAVAHLARRQWEGWAYVRL